MTPLSKKVRQENLAQGNLAQENLAQESLLQENSLAEKTPSEPSTCWQQVGVWGDRTCAELTEFSHCRDCPTYGVAGAQLLHRPIPPSYLAEQTQQFATPAQRAPESEVLSALVFRLGQEWLAISAGLCQQILSPVAAHTLPYRSNPTLLGVVNVQGQLMLKVSLLESLGLMSQSPEHADGDAFDGTKIYPRMVVIGHTADQRVGTTTDSWVFDVDELYGVQSVARSRLEAVAASSAQTCTRAVFEWHGQQVSFLDDRRLFEALRQRAL